MHTEIMLLLDIGSWLFKGINLCFEDANNKKYSLLPSGLSKYSCLILENTQKYHTDGLKYQKTIGFGVVYWRCLW